jgi:hypothetical protein
MTRRLAKETDMAQSTTTVTPPNPTPPTNFSCTGATPPNPPNYTKTQYANPFNMDANGRPQAPYGVNPNPPPYFDDGTGAVALAFAANTGALASGTGATSGGTEGSYPGTDTAPFDTPNMIGPVPASTSVAAEGAGTEVVVTQTYAAGVLVPGSAATYLPTGQTPAWAAGDPGGPVRTVSDLGNYVGGSTSINESHASKVANTPTISALSQQNTASGAGNVSQAVTGTGFNRTSVIYVNGIEQTTTYTSATSITAPTVAKKLTAGTWPVVVINGDTRRQSASFTWTFT